MRQSIALLLAAGLAAGIPLHAAAQPAAATAITLGPTIAVDGTGVAVEGTSLTITEAGTYTISGALADGSVTVDAPGAAVELVLAGADIANSAGPAILFRAAGEARVTLAAGSENRLADGGASDFDAALYSRPALILDGEGSLAVEAVYEGISSEMHLTFAGGAVRIRAEEDGINANNDGVSVITVAGGYLYVETTTGDAIDSNGTIVITGGTIIAQGALSDANSGLDADGGVTISGGTVLATGSARGAGMTRIAGDQPAILANYASVQPAGTLAALLEGDAALFTFAPAIAYQSLLYSAPGLVAGTAYTVATGGTTSGDAVDGYAAAPGYAGGTAVGTVTAGTVGGRR